jgi:hypothetical protein
LTNKAKYAIFYPGIATVRETILARAAQANGGGLFQRRRRGFEAVSFFRPADGPIKFPFI